MGAITSRRKSGAAVATRTEKKHREVARGSKAKQERETRLRAEKEGMRMRMAGKTGMGGGKK